MGLKVALRILILLLFAVIAIAPAAAADAQSPAFEWGGLEPGPFAAGFRSEWRLDRSRSYRTMGELGDLYGGTKSPRPILLNIWYPARAGTGRRMIHRDYYRIAPRNPTLARLASRLSDYARNIAVSEMRRKTIEQFDATDRATVEAMLNASIAARRNASPAPGRFPLIIYHSGFGSSFADNSILCEYLASHGFVVVGSAFLRRDGSSFNIDSEDGSIGDLRFIAATAGEWPNVDWSRIGLVGHSGGAQTLFKYQAAGASLANAIVSLDTTQDNHSLGTPLWRWMTEPVLAHIDNMTTPTLFFAPSTAIFQMADRMLRTDRYLATTTQLEHNDYITHGALAASFESRSTDAERAAHARATRAEYDRVVRTILLFFDGYLRDAANSRPALRDASARNIQILPSIEYLPAGQTQTQAYDESSTAPPTPRQLRLLVEQQGAERGAGMIERFGAARNTAAIYTPIFPAVWLNELVSEGKADRARAIFRAYRNVDTRLSQAIEDEIQGFGNVIARIGELQAAMTWLRTVLVLNPDNQGAAVKISEIERTLASRR